MPKCCRIPVHRHHWLLRLLEFCLRLWAALVRIPLMRKADQKSQGLVSRALKHLDASWSYGSLKHRHCHSCCICWYFSRMPLDEFSKHSSICIEGGKLSLFWCCRLRPSCSQYLCFTRRRMQQYQFARHSDMELRHIDTVHIHIINIMSHFHSSINYSI